MSEEVKNEGTPSPEAKNPFDETNWNENQNPEEKKEEVIEKKEEPKKEEEEEILDPNDWVKREFGWENTEAGKKEIEELRKFKTEAKPAEEIKFANDASKQLYELIKDGKEEDVYKVLDKKFKLSTAEKMDAASAIKLNLKLKNEHYNEDDVNDIYNEQYTFPKKPVQKDDELDEDFKERTGVYDNEVSRINRKIERDAKDAKLSLSQMATELVLPDIQKKSTEPEKKEPTQQELEQAQKVKDDFLKKSVEALKVFTGFSTTVEDKDVKLSVSYGSSDEEKKLVSEQISTFVEKGFDANAILASRWLNEDGALNESRMVKDLSLLNNEEKVIQKLASESANQRLEKYLESKKNININEQKQNGTFNPEKDGQTEMQKVQEFFWNN